MSNLEMERLWFLRGVLAAFASSGEVVQLGEICKLCRLRPEEASTYLEAARQGLHEDEPDFCDVIAAETGGGAGTPRGPSGKWPARLRDAHQYWRDRRYLEDQEFEKEWSWLPTFPGPPGTGKH
jgi:hypothetical protein